MVSFLRASSENEMKVGHRKVTGTPSDLLELNEGKVGKEEGKQRMERSW